MGAELGAVPHRPLPLPLLSGQSTGRRTSQSQTPPGFCLSPHQSGHGSPWHLLSVFLPCTGTVWRSCLAFMHTCHKQLPRHTLLWCSFKKLYSDCSLEVNQSSLICILNILHVSLHVPVGILWKFSTPDPLKQRSLESGCVYVAVKVLSQTPTESKEFLLAWQMFTLTQWIYAKPWTHNKWISYIANIISAKKISHLLQLLNIYCFFLLLAKKKKSVQP